MAFEFARVFEPVVKAGAVDSLVLCGGAAKNPHVRGLFATLFAPFPTYHVIETELMGTRGCLHAFAPRLASARTARVQPERQIDPCALAAARALYLTTFNRLYGQVSAGKAYSLKRAKRK